MNSNRPLSVLITLLISTSEHIYHICINLRKKQLEKAFLATKMLIFTNAACFYTEHTYAGTLKDTLPTHIHPRKQRMHAHAHPPTPTRAHNNKVSCQEDRTEMGE